MVFVHGVEVTISFSRTCFILLALLASRPTAVAACPLGPDLDFDGVCDGQDVCPGFDDFDDVDIDGVADGCDTCPDSYNPNQGAAFGAQEIITDTGLWAAYPTDLDGDGDLDVLSSTAWYENLGGGNFGPKQTIAVAAGPYGATGIQATDVDGDGDHASLSISVEASSPAIR